MSEPRFIVVQCVAAPVAQGVYSLSARYRNQPVWTQATHGGNKLVFTAMDGRWYVGGDGAQEQGWVRSIGESHPDPTAVSQWEVRNGGTWVPGEAGVKVFSIPEPDTLQWVETPCFPNATGWYTKSHSSTWDHPSGFSIADRKGHWCVTSSGVYLLATTEPHYGTSPGCGLEWVLLSSGVGERRRRVVESAEEHKRLAEKYRAQAEEFTRLAEAEDAKYMRAVEDGRVAEEEREHAEIFERQREAARVADTAVKDAVLAVEKATKVRSGSENPTRCHKDVRDQAVLAARAAECAADHALRLREDEQVTETPVSEALSAPPSVSAASHPVPALEPQLHQSGLVSASVPCSEAVSLHVPESEPRDLVQQSEPEPVAEPELIRGVLVQVPGASILSGKYCPSTAPPHCLVFKDFRIYDNNGYWAIGTHEDIAKGVGWLASVQKHVGRPPHDPTLDWRKWVGHEWEGDAEISLTECVMN